MLFLLEGRKFSCFECSGFGMISGVAYGGAKRNVSDPSRLAEHTLGTLWAQSGLAGHFTNNTIN